MFTPLKLGTIELKNRCIMAPLTRCRADIPGHIANDMMAEYYAQRASAGLIIAESAIVQKGHSSFLREPGIYNEACVEGWKKTTKAVHAKGGKIVLQINAAGRTALPQNEPDEGDWTPIAPSPIALNKTSRPEWNPSGEAVPFVTPRELKDEEIPAVIELYAEGARNAIKAGFDGVEIHGANGYLCEQFLKSESNKRESGRYAGKTVETRCQFVIDVVDAVIKAVGDSQLVSLRISPLGTKYESKDEDPEGLTRHLCKELDSRNLGFIDLMRGDFTNPDFSNNDVFHWVLESTKTPLIAGLGYDYKEAEEHISKGLCCAVLFGKKFIGNPDLPYRLEHNLPLNENHEETYFTKTKEGYTDYPEAKHEEPVEAK